MSISTSPLCVTIDLAGGLAVYLFGSFLKDPKNCRHAKNALAGNGTWAATTVRE